MSKNGFKIELTKRCTIIRSEANLYWSKVTHFWRRGKWIKIGNHYLHINANITSGCCDHTHCWNTISFWWIRVCGWATWTPTTRPLRRCRRSVLRRTTSRTRRPLKSNDKKHTHTHAHKFTITRRDEHGRGTAKITRDSFVYWRIAADVAAGTTVAVTTAAVAKLIA